MENTAARMQMMKSGCRGIMFAIETGGHYWRNIAYFLEERSIPYRFINQFIRNNTKPDTEAIYTDDWPSYRGIGDKDTRHETVNHSAEEWVNGNVHTNTIEGAWSLLKRSIVGSYHKLSTKHLNSYLDELEWRFNNRENPYLFNETLIKLIRAKHIKYSQLTTD